MGENKNCHSVCGNYNRRDKNQADISEKDIQSHQNSVTVNKHTSLGTLIVWNISKALKNNPDINLLSALNAVQAKLGQESSDVSSIMSPCLEERYLSCAVLAWQQLGHENADSLYHFYRKNKPTPNSDNKATTNKKQINCSANDFKQKFSKDGFYSKQYVSSYDSFSIGPVVKLPIQTKIVMRLENASSGRQTGKKQKTTEKEIKDKIEAACCMDTECIERLTAVDATTTELRTRAAKLACREAERVELLERAETAWKDLELGYQRRLVLAEEKEDNLSKQIQKLIDERNGYKTACINLAQNLKERGQFAEKQREALTKLEKEVCGRACIRLRLSEESARDEAILNENQIRVSQLDRDLQFKEEQARHKLLSIEGEVSSARALTHETERAMRAELGALREQVAQVSDQLLEEEAENERLKSEIDALEKEKLEMIEDLDGCKIMCDNRMQGGVDELQKKRAQLNELKDKVMECRCKLPIDVNVEVKRTPSFAALCRCPPEEKILESCSCTSLRGRLLSNLLADLFGGLQTELGGSVSKMPCQLLKCLEDKHNWDRTSIVKKNLQQFFSQLLVAELDIAIATAIEKYHAKWIGSTCADRAKLTAEPGEIEDEGWQERLLEQRAQKLASQLAEQLFQERAEQLTRRAKDIVMSAPPPCACKPQTIFPCLVKSTRMPTSTNEGGLPNNVGVSGYWKRALKDIMQLKLDIDNMKKRSIKKGDFKLMEENIMKIMELVSSPDTNNISPTPLDNCKWKIENRCESKDPKSSSAISGIFMTPSSKRGATMKKKKLDTSIIKKGNKCNNLSKVNTNILGKSYNKIGQTFAVNLCLCGTQNNAEKIAEQNKIIVNKVDKMTSWKQTPSKVTIPHISGIKQSKPINTNHLSSKIIYSKSDQSSCQKDCVCFNKLPSNTSIDRLLTTLTKWKSVLTHSVENHIEETKTNEPIKIIDNIRSNDCSSKTENNESNIHQQSLEQTENTSQLNNNEVCSFSHKEKQKFISKHDDEKHIVPENNNSEYMAAINLDKSNENCCQCVKNTIKTSNVAFEGKIELPFKCINTNDCICKQSIKSMNSKLNEQKLLRSSEIKNINQNSQPQCNKNENINNMQMEENTFVTENVQNDVQGNNINEFEDSEACDCDYFINFLGVTLANINSQKKNQLPVTDENRDAKQCTAIHYYNANNDFVQSNNEIKLGKLNNAIENEPTYIEYKSKTVTCECKGNVLTKCFEDKDINVHSSIYMANLQDTIRKQKSCVCCNYYNLDETNNLEENAFNLLEEYLKDKLKDFHKFSCKSSCISSEEEEKLFSAILHNVKDVISKHITQMTCKCSESERIEGNWNRAYGLLQEYLKMKIKRVQCLCIPRESTSLPVKSILDRVSSLINNDFRRLKKMCKCNIEKTNKKKSPTSDLYKEEIPVRDLNDCQEVESGNYSSVQGITNSSRIVQLSTNSSFTTIHTNNDFKRSHNNISNCHNNNLPSSIRGSTQNIENIKTSHYIKHVLDTKNNPINLNKISVQTSNKSIILNENTSCQVPPNLGMVTKSCDCLQISTKNVQTISTTSEKGDNFCKLSQYDTGCDCRYNFIEKDNISLGIERREVLVNRCTELEKSDDSCSKINNVNKILCNQSLLEEINITASFEAKDLAFSSTKLTRSTNKITPYLGCTIDCSCDERNLSSCVCLKSGLQENNCKITDIWKSVTEKSCFQKTPYLCTNNTLHKGIKGESEICYKNIMNQNRENIIITTLIDGIEIRNKINTTQRANQNVCDIKVSAHGEEDLVLKSSKATNSAQMHNTSNTLDDSIRLETNYVNAENHTDWYECPEVCEPRTKLLIHNKRENDTLYPFDEYKYFTTDKNIDAKSIISLSNQSYHDCNCDMVPICHVKMLVENIENRLGNCSCTCDSLISDVCPVHSTKFL